LDILLSTVISILVYLFIAKYKFNLDIVEKQDRFIDVLLIWGAAFAIATLSVNALLGVTSLISLILICLFSIILSVYLLWLVKRRRRQT
jgi:hypothetical protein